MAVSDTAIAIAIPELKFCAVLGHDRNRRVAFERLRPLCGRRRDATEIGRLGYGVTGEQAKTCKCGPTGACQPCHGNFPFGVHV